MLLIKTEVRGSNPINFTEHEHLIPVVLKKTRTETSSKNRKVKNTTTDESKVVLYCCDVRSDIWSQIQFF